MAQVPEQVLQWLWNALQGNYHNPQVTYSDAVSVLSTYSSLQPRTDVYTYNNGQPALLLCLTGTLPVTFRGTVYRFPIRVWVPHGHPRDPEGIMVFVIPGETMMIRPGQHVSVDGRIYHPYLRDWSSRQQSTIAEFLRILQDVFAREPPVVAKQQQQQQQYRQPAQPQSPGQRPPPPPKERPGSVTHQQQQQPVEMPAGPHPPPKPPKQEDQGRDGTPIQHQQRETRRDGPPLPPLPHERVQQGYQSPQLQQRANDFATPPRSQQSYASASNGGPQVPRLPPHGRDAQSHARNSPVSPITPNGFGQPGSSKRYSHAPPLPQSPMQPSGSQHPQPPYPGPQSQLQQPQPPRHMPNHQQLPPVAPQQQYQQSYTPQQQYPPQQAQLPYQQQHQHHPQQQQQQQYQQHPPPPQAAPKPAPPPDLLTDPFDITLPTSAPQAAPPIPPNPEKEHLLHLLSQSLVAQSHQKIHQNASALPSLRAQSQAMQEASQRLQFELAQLEQLDRVLASNEAILRSAMDECDNVIKDSKDRPEPAVDEVLVAPSIVQNQLWNLEAEIAGLKEGLWVLQRAVGAGRVGAVEFGKLNRSLARELFLKMALGRKIAVGLGLDVGVGGGLGGDRGGNDEGFYS